MTRVDKRNAVMLLSLVALAAVVGSTVLAVYAVDETGTNKETKVGIRPWGLGHMRGWRPLGPIEVSADYKAKVISIAQSDPDVQGLLADGYNVTRVMPIIKSVVDANGAVTTKATSAIVELQKGKTSHASVQVSLDEAKVKQIVIQTRTVITK